MQTFSDNIENVSRLGGHHFLGLTNPDVKKECINCIMTTMPHLLTVIYFSLNGFQDESNNDQI